MNIFNKIKKNIKKGFEVIDFVTFPDLKRYMVKKTSLFSHLGFKSAQEATEDETNGLFVESILYIIYTIVDAIALTFVMPLHYLFIFTLDVCLLGYKIMSALVFGFVQPSPVAAPITLIEIENLITLKLRNLFREILAPGAVPAPAPSHANCLNVLTDLLTQQETALKMEIQEQTVALKECQKGFFCGRSKEENESLKAALAEKRHAVEVTTETIKLLEKLLNPAPVRAPIPVTGHIEGEEKDASRSFLMTAPIRFNLSSRSITSSMDRTRQEAESAIAPRKKAIKEDAMKRVNSALPNGYKVIINR